MRFSMSLREIFYLIMEDVIKIYLQMNLRKKFIILELQFKTLVMNQSAKIMTSINVL